MEALLARFAKTRGWPVWARYAATLAVSPDAAGLHLVLEETLGRHPYGLELLAAMACALVFDRGSGYIALAVGAFSIAWLSRPPYRSLELAESGAVISVLL